MAWTNIPDSDLDEESPIKEHVLKELRDNVDAIFNGDPGAPSLVDAAIKLDDIDGDVVLDNEILRAQIVNDSITSRTISANQINRTLIDTTLLTLTVSQFVALPPNGHQFNLGAVIGPRMLGYHTRYNPRIGGDVYKFRMGKKRGAPISFGTDLDLLQHAWFWVSGVAVGTSTIEINILYVTASPPWDLGGGEIPLFMFAMIDNDKNIVGFTSGKDPSWGTNDKTYKKDGKQFVKQHLDMEKARNNKKYYDEFKRKLENVNGIEGDDFVELEYSQDIKNRFKDLVPTHFGHVPEGHEVVMIDPVSDFCHELALLSQAGENLNYLFTQKKIELKDEIIGAKTPGGLKALKAGWA